MDFGIKKRRKGIEASTRGFRCEGYRGNNVPELGYWTPLRPTLLHSSLDPRDSTARAANEKNEAAASLGLMVPEWYAHWLRPATWLVKRDLTMGGSTHGTAYGTCSLT
ncbi:hypothetical protein KPH14_008778 [Odynerus spinipes]|uniref:Uncharacterized protein n=1 Tax=Odynerus spinipes TaxID=1348599 RepID=A0AAD9R8L1_9HYME|nr:hypothetical protein KPH14_008778 [Odynerus spinipes]